MEQIHQFMQQGDFVKAIALLQKQWIESPSVEICMLLTIAYTNVHQLDDALATVEKGIEKFPDNASLYSERAVVYFHNNKKNLALLDMDKAFMLEPLNPYRYSSRAYIKDSLGDIHGAMKDYLKAVELDPEDSISLNNLAMLEEKLGNMQKAQSYAKKADRLAKEIDLVFEKEDEAKPIVTSTITTDPFYKENRFSIMKKVFTSKDTFKEFIKFLMNKK